MMDDELDRAMKRRAKNEADSPIAFSLTYADLHRLGWNKIDGGSSVQTGSTIYDKSGRLIFSKLYPDVNGLNATPWAYVGYK